MRGLERVVVPGALAGAWVLAHALPIALATGPEAARAIGRGIVLLFVLSVVVEAMRALPPPVRSRLTAIAHTPRALLGFGLLWWACTLALMLLSGAILRAPRGTGSLRWSTGLSHGPLASWPHLEAEWPALGVGLQLGVGRLLVLATLALLVALTLLAARARTAPVRGGAAQAWPALLVAPACPACLTPTLGLLVALGGASLAPGLERLMDPRSVASALLEVAGPLLALLVLARLCDGGARPVARARPASAVAALAAPAVAAPLLQARFLALAPDGASDIYAALERFSVVVTLVAVLLFLPVVLLVIYYPLRYRARREGADEGEPERRARPLTRRMRRALIATYTLVPAVLILGLGVMSVDLLVAMETPPTGTLHVDVTGEQFDWYFTMPDGSITKNVLRVPLGEVVVLHVSSADVVHSFYVPALGVKTDALPDHENDIWFRAVEPGEYHAHCAEFCGFGHTHMRASVIVEPTGGAG